MPDSKASDGEGASSSSSTDSQPQQKPQEKPAVVKDKPLTDILAGALARAGSQSTIHPIDTLKVRMQSGFKPGPSRGVHVSAAGVQALTAAAKMQRGLSDLGSLYKGVFGAATGAGIIIGSYFAFYSNTKNALRTSRPEMPESQVAFVAGAVAAVGSSVVKVPLAVCIRSVQAGVYPNVFNAAQTITGKAGWAGLFTGLVPTLLEDVPDMAVKFTAYESMRTLHARMHDGKQPSVLEDLVMGGVAGAAAAAATTPLDCIKTRMMCSASERPTVLSAARAVLADGKGWRGLFTGIGPRAVSNGLNSAVFFCFFEILRRWLLELVAEQDLARLVEQQRLLQQQQHQALELQQGRQGARGGRGGARPASLTCAAAGGSVLAAAGGGAAGPRKQRGTAALLSLALPLDGGGGGSWHGRA
ncbi:hypothetical protein FOA52_001251 [Chlamydomonas sp. UWO 241]|nr:hypothetical protein FOA52_001251 [Chlamydomonas sp. UWO 241]